MKDPFKGTGLRHPRVRPIGEKKKQKGTGPGSGSANKDVFKVPQATLNGLRRGGVPAKAVLNPNGKLGAYGSEALMKQGYAGAYREDAMKRKRAVLMRQKAVALEMHELQQLARENATGAMETLIEISGNKRAPESSRIAASAVILDRGYGKSSQTSITANVTNGKASEITADQLEQRIGQALERVEKLTKRAPKAPASEDRPADLHKYN